MRLENEQQAAAAPGVRLTPNELQEVMTEAIQRHGQAERAAEQRTGLSTVEDALEIARSLNIPEEHVRAAIADRGRLKLREERRLAVRGRRRAGFLFGLASVVGLEVLLSFVGFASLTLFTLLLLHVPLLAVLGILAHRWLAAPVSDAEADRTEVLPVTGKCRVCGADAYAPRATFCEEHRYRGPQAQS